MAEQDLGKIVGMILENPALVEQIKAMATEGTQKEDENSSSGEPTVARIIPEPTRPSSSRRSELLRALRSFVSPERQRGLDTMMTIASVLDSMKTK